VKNARFGISSPHWELLTLLLLDPIKKAGGRVWLFGSRARGDHHRFSDVDTLIDGPISPTLLSSISENLEESALPIRVDLVLESDLADAYRIGVMKERIEI
jgi:uncharacterized protein